MNCAQRVALTNLIDAQGLLIIAQLSNRYSAEEFEEAERYYSEMQDIFIASASDTEVQQMELEL